MDTKEKIRQYERGFRAGQKEQLEKLHKDWYNNPKSKTNFGNYLTKKLRDL